MMKSFAEKLIHVPREAISRLEGACLFLSPLQAISQRVTTRSIKYGKSDVSEEEAAWFAIRPMCVRWNVIKNYHFWQKCD